MSRRRSRARRTIAFLLRDARGRFMRVLPTIAELAATRKPRARRRPRPSATATATVQLALF